MKAGARGERGQSLVEFALVLPVLLLLILGLIDVARAIAQENTLASAAREGARYAIVHGSSSSSPVGWCSSCTNITAINNAVSAAAIGVPTVTVTVDYPDSSNRRGSRVSVIATSAFVPLPSQYLLGGALTVTLRGGSTMVIEY